VFTHIDHALFGDESKVQYKLSQFGIKSSKGRTIYAKDVLDACDEKSGKDIESCFTGIVVVP
jgi:hypothetical protein